MSLSPSRAETAARVLGFAGIVLAGTISLTGRDAPFAAQHDNIAGSALWTLIFTLPAGLFVASMGARLRRRQAAAGRLAVLALGLAAWCGAVAQETFSFPQTMFTRSVGTRLGLVCYLVAVAVMVASWGLEERLARPKDVPGI